MEIVLNAITKKPIFGPHKQDQVMRLKPNSIGVQSVSILGESIDENW